MDIVDDKDARIFELEDALHQAISTVEFLHGCLTAPDRYSYAYPEQTRQHLDRWRQLAPPPPLCVHSRTMPGCDACQQRLQRARRRAQLEPRRDTVS